MTTQQKQPKTLYDKIYQNHIICSESEKDLIYIDRHLVHEVTSPQAFDGLLKSNRMVRRPDLTLATVDHNIPTSSRKNYLNAASFVSQKDSKQQVLTLEDNVEKFKISYFGMDDSRQGIVHVIGPEQGFTLPGTTLVCGDSHTSTHGAFGALAFGIGTSEVEHVLATQAILQKKSKNMRINVVGNLAEGVGSKDVVLHIIGEIGTAGGTGHVIEFAGSAIESLSMESRMSICNMAIEAGARAGLIAPDQTTFAYLKDRPLAPGGEMWSRALSYWQTLKSDPEAHWDSQLTIQASDIAPTLTWGTTPQDVCKISDTVPSPQHFTSQSQREGVQRSLDYMGLVPGVKITDIPINKVFIGSCTNSRIEDLRSAARIAKGRKVASGVYAMVVPGSGLVKKQAEEEGLAQIFMDAGFDWREAGCSMCLGMNEDQLKPLERCASTSNRNFEGRQGYKGRTHLMSPAMAAAAAINGTLADVRDFLSSSTPAAMGKVVELESASFPLDSKSYTKPFSRKDAKADTANAPTTSASAAASTSSGGMPPFTVLKGVAAPLPMSNIDTDKIIPKQFLKTITRTGLGAGLFYEMRYSSDKVLNPDFVLNKPQYQSAKILIAGENFGCGSSREHAPWALNDFGIRCIIAPSFADIFENNTTKNGMLPITLPASLVDVLLKEAESGGGGELEIDLPNQTITRPNGQQIRFEIEAFRKHCLVNGLDDIGLTLQKQDLIKLYEEKVSKVYPWVDGWWRGGLIGSDHSTNSAAKHIDW